MHASNQAQGRKAYLMVLDGTGKGRVGHPLEGGAQGAGIVALVAVLTAEQEGFS